MYHQLITRLSHMQDFSCVRRIASVKENDKNDENFKNDKKDKNCKNDKNDKNDKNLQDFSCFRGIASAKQKQPFRGALCTVIPFLGHYYYF